ncbi:MAG: hypothetical protein JXM72_12415 [Deltaproteobacteria bacterium]|nr:hypothetical protein [Deltaproteobacteria bacterium]
MALLTVLTPCCRLRQDGLRSPDRTVTSARKKPPRPTVTGTLQASAKTFMIILPMG